MKDFVKASAIFAVFCLACACAKNPVPEQAAKGIDAIDTQKVDAYYSCASVSVPAATESVAVVYTAANGSTVTRQVAVTPQVAQPVGGKDVEPFGTVKLLFEAPVTTKVSVYYTASPATKAEEEGDQVYLLTDFPVDQITFGEFGKTRYVQMPWSFGWANNASTNWQNAPAYPADVVMYDEAHNHTLRYRFAYAGGVAGEGYFLDEAYTIENHVVTGYKYTYCGGCGNCPYCMPWGCSCGCGTTNNPNFKASGDTTGGKEAELPELPEEVVEVALPEPAPYKTEDMGFAYYHSSGVVMFDDSWPRMPEEKGAGAYDYDFNDVVVDYDLEARTVPDALLESEGWREQVKVVLHLRAVGGDKPERVGLIMEGFDQQYVSSIETYCTLDSWQNPHGELPAWTKRTLQENSLHVETDPLRPMMEIGAIFRLRENMAGNAEGEYTYVNGNFTNTTVFNPALKLYEPWGGPHTQQYREELADVTVPTTLAKMQQCKYYNTVPGYVNVSGGLYTYTVIYNMKARASMSAEESQKALKNMVDAVVNTTQQNFYIIAKNGGSYVPVGLKGYQPAEVAIKGFPNGYKALYDNAVAADGSQLSTSTPYMSQDGHVWAFKCPVLTHHVWEKMYFSLAYPQYEGWVRSRGAENTDWYKEQVDSLYLTCPW